MTGNPLSTETQWNPTRQKLALRAKTRTAILALGALILTVGVIGSYRRAHAAPVVKTIFNHDASCTSLYNSRLTDAQLALKRGDRAGALAALIDAKEQLDRCVERDGETASGASALSLNSKARRELSAT